MRLDCDSMDEFDLSEVLIGRFMHKVRSAESLARFSAVRLNLVKHLEQAFVSLPTTCDFLRCPHGDRSAVITY